MAFSCCRVGHRPIHLELSLIPDLPSFQCRAIDVNDYFWNVANRVRVGHLKLKILLSQLSQLMESPGSTLYDLEQLDIFIIIQANTEVSAMPQFISRACSVTLYDLNLLEKEYFPLVQTLALQWAQLTCLHVIHADITFSQCMALLHQTPLLEECHLSLNFVDVEEEERLTLPLIRTFMLDFGDEEEFIDPVIRRFEFPNLSRLRLDAWDWPTESYEVIKRYYNLCRIQDLQLFPHAINPFTIANSTILKDAPLLQNLDVSTVAAIDEEALDGISSGELGHFLKILTISCPESEMEAALDMVEARQKAVAQKIEHGYSWREVELTGLKEVRIRVLQNSRSTRRRNAIENYRQRYKERLGELERLGVRVGIRPWSEWESVGLDM